MIRRQFAGNEAGIREISDADRDIDALAHDIDKGIGEGEVERDIGVALENCTRCGATCRRPKVFGAEIRRVPRALDARWETQLSASSTLASTARTRS